MSLSSVLERGIELYQKEGFVRTAETGCIYASSMLYHRLGGLRPYNTNGINIFSEDWDNLILLDACRADIFEEYVAPELPGRFETRVSRGSSTSEFVRSNFSGDLSDVVYISSNGWYLRLRDQLNCEFHKVYDVYNEAQMTEQKVVEAARDAAKNHPDKRLLIHLLPPHHPYVGPTADDVLPSYEEQERRPFFERVRQGEIQISDDQLRQCYRENLDRGLSALSELLSIVDGKTVVSGDHGELLGERITPLPIKYYGHIPSLYVPELVNVPWTVIDGERREIEKGSGSETINRTYSQGGKTVDERLRDLGYKI